MKSFSIEKPIIYIGVITNVLTIWNNFNEIQLNCLPADMKDLCQDTTSTFASSLLKYSENMIILIHVPDQTLSSILKS